MSLRCLTKLLSAFMGVESTPKQKITSKRFSQNMGNLLLFFVFWERWTKMTANMKRLGKYQGISMQRLWGCWGGRNFIKETVTKQLSVLTLLWTSISSILKLGSVLEQLTWESKSFKKQHMLLEMWCQLILTQEMHGQIWQLASSNSKNLKKLNFVLNKQ